MTMSAMHIPVVAVVTFPAQTDRSTSEMRSLLEEAGPAYVAIPGLRRKYFLSGDSLAGGVYEWATREQAVAFYDEAWYAAMTERSGSRPEVVLFDSPAIADGINHQLDIYLPADT
jgi:hypothetical protein